jgi:hypothetical protein
MKHWFSDEYLVIQLDNIFLIENINDIYDRIDNEDEHDENTGIKINIVFDEDDFCD